MNTKHKLAIVAAGLFALGTLALLSFGKAGRLTAFSSQPHADTAIQEAQRSATKDDVATADAFDRLLIRNIATVPFVELFDLLRSAPVETRSRWIKQLDEMPAGPQQTAALMSFYKTFVQIDPHAAAESVAGVHDKLAQSFVVEAMIGAAPASAMEEMAEMLIKLPSDIFWGARRFSWRDVIYDWSAVDPVAAAHFIEEHPDISAHQSDTLLSNWAEMDPDAAKTWLERQSESVQTEEAIAGLVGGWADRDEASALAFVLAHASAGNFKRAIGNLADNLFHRSPDEARAFILRLPNEARSAAVGEIASMTTGVVLGLPESWRRPPEDVAKWILTLPKESWGDAMAGVLESWDRRDAIGLVTFINQLPVETRDQIAAEYCSSYSEHREQAVTLGLTISNATLRDQSLRKLMSRWLPDSREEALLTITESELSEAQKKYLIKLLPSE